jgi:hypothetical protein
MGRGAALALALCVAAAGLAPQAHAARAAPQAAGLDAGAAHADSPPPRHPEDKTLGFSLGGLANAKDELAKRLSASDCLPNLAALGGLDAALGKLEAAKDSGSKYTALSGDAGASGEFFALVGELGLTDKVEALAPALFALRVCQFQVRKKAVDQLNGRNGTKARFKHNIFSLLIDAEKAKARGALPPKKQAPQVIEQQQQQQQQLQKLQQKQLELSSGARPAGDQSAPAPVSTSTYPSNLSYVGGAITSSPLNQGQCGGCWAFSAAEVISAQAWLESSTTVPGGAPAVQLSPQQLISCDSAGGNTGCNGGWPSNVWQYYTPRTALVTLSAYPYSSTTSTTGVAGSCSIPSGVAGTLASQNAYVGPGNGVQGATNDQMVAALQNTPFSIAIYASAPCFENYASGTLSVDDCNVASPCPDVDHAIVMVGYMDYPNNTVWQVKNQWGSSWGENGFAYFSAAGMGEGNCQGLLQVNLYGMYPQSTSGAMTNSPTAPTAPTPPTTPTSPFQTKPPSTGSGSVLSAPLLGSLLAILAALGQAAFL